MRHLPLAAAILLAGTLAAAQTAPAPKLPFTLSKETTLITSPLLADGTPDFVAALNQKLSQGVTPDNNGYVLWLSIIDPKSIVQPDRERPDDEKTAAKIIQLTGAKPPADGAPVFQDFFTWLESRAVDKSGQQAAKLEFYLLRTQPWSAADHPLVAGYLQSQSKFLDVVVDAAERPHWWFPYLSADGRSISQMILPDVTTLRQAANALAARATLRFNTGDFAGFLRDALAVKRLAHHLASAATLWECGCGASISRAADEALGAAAGSGTLTPAQCQALAAALASLPQLPDISQGFAAEHQQHLDFIFLLTTGQLDALKNLTRNQTGVFERFAAIDAASVDWDALLKQVNDYHNQVAAAVSSPTLKTFHDAIAPLDAISKKIDTDQGARPDFHKRPNESSSAYSQRITDYFLFPSGGPSWLTGMLETSKNARLADQMLNTLLAAATQKAQTGIWPKTLADLVPADIKQIPLDLYPIDNPAPIKFLLSKNGLRLYSIGPNGVDDSGQSDTTSRDDIAIGPPPPPAEALP